MNFVAITVNGLKAERSRRRRIKVLKNKLTTIILDSYSYKLYVYLDGRCGTRINMQLQLNYQLWVDKSIGLEEEINYALNQK